MNSLYFPFAYQGQEKDPETNLLNFELRQFDVRLGRWQCPDPMKEFHSPYLAMGNNPASVTDPTGGYTSDQFWNETQMPNIGQYKNYDFKEPNNSDGAKINDVPSADPNANPYFAMTPAERRKFLAQNGTSYEAQFSNKFFDLVFLGGYKDKDGNMWIYRASKNAIGSWSKDNPEGKSKTFKANDRAGFAFAVGHTATTVGEKWTQLGVNGREEYYMWASRTYGGTGDGSTLDNIHQTVSRFNSNWNPIAHMINGMSGVAYGTDRFGNNQSGWETATQSVSGILGIFGGAIADAYVGAATKGVNIAAKDMIFSGAEKEALMAATGYSRTRIINGNAVIDQFGYFRGISNTQVNLIKQGLRNNGATSIKIYTNSANAKMGNLLQSRMNSGRGIFGLTIESRIAPGYILRGKL